jgi:CHAD domain-containing protein
MYFYKYVEKVSRSMLKREILRKLEFQRVKKNRNCQNMLNKREISFTMHNIYNSINKKHELSLAHINTYLDHPGSKSIRMLIRVLKICDRIQQKLQQCSITI